MNKQSFSRGAAAVLTALAVVSTSVQAAPRNFPLDEVIETCARISFRNATGHSLANSRFIIGLNGWNEGTTPQAKRDQARHIAQRRAALAILPECRTNGL
jgi:hypothetical protein